MKRGLRSQTSRGSIMFFLFLLRGKVLVFIDALSLPLAPFWGLAHLPFAVRSKGTENGVRAGNGAE